ncbi:MAG: hypothetical protein A3J37_05800 [Alphaproteobacteria bacterium RIFCSPHIGHO2_12_FULL_45_9]|nr:MAG: hypothetical protein A3B66_04970 [Alphaproteobacteria bacterium RIFCSPHIGHO2_02_FULL_46_13]OFW94912.1 MAG: hypothetical protein A3J37_05800 [Alphaproteobacteria bacterium RIFCSPHIGHO2_12_FULL_45_9]
MPRESSDEPCKLEIKLGLFKVNADGRAPVWMATGLAVLFLLLIGLQIDDLGNFLFSQVMHLKLSLIPVK